MSNQDLNFMFRDKPQTREFVTRSFQVRADTVNEEERSIDAVLATENPVEVIDWRRYEVIEEVLRMDGVTIPNHVPLLNNHNRYSLEHILGSVENVRVEGNQLIGTLVFVRDDETADKIWNKVKQGHIRNVSVGYKYPSKDSYVDISPGESATVGGKRYKAGDRIRRVTLKWGVRESSAVVFGADEAAKMRSELEIEGNINQAGASPVKNRSGNMDKLRQYLESQGLRSEATDQEIDVFLKSLNAEQQARVEQIRAEMAEDDAEANGAGTGNDGGSADDGAGDGERSAVGGNQDNNGNGGELSAEEISLRAVTAERQRQRTLRSMARDDVPPTVLQRAIDDGLSPEEANGVFLNAIRANRPNTISGGAAIHSHSHEQDVNQRTLAMGLMLRISQVPEGEDNARLAEVAQRNGLHNYSLVDLAAECLRMAGETVPRGAQNIIRALTSGNQRAAVSTGSLAAIFTTSVNARLLRAYQEAANTTDGWVDRVDVPNFQTNERILGDLGDDLELLPRGGEAKHESPSDDKEEYKIARYAKKFTIDEQDLIDDRLDYFQSRPRKMGQAAARLLSDLVYSILLANANLSDGNALFSGAHNNDNTLAFSAANLKTALTAMMLQTKDDKPLNIRAVYLLVAAELEFTARELIRSSEIRLAGSTDTERGNRNVISDENLQLRSDPRLSLGVTDPYTKTAHAGAATKWFLTADPGAVPTIEVGYLAGTNRTPQVRSKVLDGGQWGILYDINHNLGAKALDFRGLYRGNV